MASIEIWAPPNGWPLASVAKSRGWPHVQVPGGTVALADNGTTYVEGSVANLDAAIASLEGA